MPVQPAVVLDKKADLLSTLKDKLLPAAAPPPPAPVAISGAPLSTTSVVRHPSLPGTDSYSLGCDTVREHWDLSILACDRVCTCQ